MAETNSITREICKGSIRRFEETDGKAVLEILRQPGGHYYTDDHIDFSGYQESYVYESNEGVLGFVCLEMQEKISQIICYVAPSWRRRGIGSQLFDYGRTRLLDLDPNTIWIFFRSDVGDSARFYQNRGAEPWYSYHFMELQERSVDLSIHHEGKETRRPDCTFDKALNYSSPFFEEYIQARSRAFLSINRLIDSQPHDERERSAEIRKWAEKHEKDIWLFFKGEVLVGSIALYEGFFDEVFVAREYQGKGLGQSIVLWALEHCQSKGWKPSLCVVTGNQPAINLYTRAGFSIAQTLEMNRLFSPNKAPDLRGPIGG